MFNEQFIIQMNIIGEGGGREKVGYPTWKGCVILCEKETK